jgi:hypothetical protein
MSSCEYIIHDSFQLQQGRSQARVLFCIYWTCHESIGYFHNQIAFVVLGITQEVVS